ncbi:MAG TPA: hypothetical protein PKL84_16535, partial [Candidatus Hydrogenedentes bacterium]|nr:hypothetical protein [Candidatus Hydrogenedentota bacterium]
MSQPIAGLIAVATAAEYFADPAAYDPEEDTIVFSRTARPMPVDSARFATRNSGGTTRSSFQWSHWYSVRRRRVSI